MQLLKNLPLQLCFLSFVFVDGRNLSISFRKGQSVEGIELGNKDLKWKTKKFAACFKFMPKFVRGYSLIDSDNLKVMFFPAGAETAYGFIDFIDSVPLQNKSIYEGYSHMFVFCNSFSLGKWMSMCFDIKFHLYWHTVQVYVWILNRVKTT